MRGSNFTSQLTDDPSTPAAKDPTDIDPPAPTPTPTLSEWGRLLLVLSLLTLGTWQLAGRPVLVGVAAAGGVVGLAPSGSLLRAVLVGQGVAGLGLLLYGPLAPLAPHDVLGAALSGVVLGVLLECYRHGRARAADRATWS